MEFTITPEKLIGTGNTADVYDIGDSKVIKLFHTGAYSQKEIEREFQNTLLAGQVGLPTAKAYEIVSLGERTGIIFDKIPGETLLDIILRTGEIEEYTLKLASLHRQILNISLPTAQSYKKNLRYKIKNAKELPPESREKLENLLESLPDGDSLCHDDFHFSNVLWDGKQTYVIDLMDICKGHRNFDIARTLYLTEFPRISRDFPDWRKVSEMQRQAAEIYLKEMGTTRDELNDYLIIAAARSLTGLTDKQAEQKSLTFKYLHSQKIL